MSRSVRRCPNCAEPIPPPEAGAAPATFCSERCRLIDLSRWLGEEHRISEPAPIGASDLAWVEDADGYDG